LLTYITRVMWLVQQGFFTLRYVNHHYLMLLFWFWFIIAACENNGKDY
jgi:hypothetical protein